jgi:hypothetical protein
MATLPNKTEPGHWFLRGVQSAAFYYLSCTPWAEYKHRKKRRKEAEEQAKERQGIVVTQPGLVRQPVAFQTNYEWAEEIRLGPGPPKGYAWKKDTLLQKVQKKLWGEPQEAAVAAAAAPKGRLPPVPSPTRPSRRERTLSSAFESIRESVFTALHPPQWNWTRYDREDEILPGLTQRVTRLWNRVTLSGPQADDHTDTEKAGESSSSQKRKRAFTDESDRYEFYQRGTQYTVDFDEPIVCQLPPTRAEAAWMKRPPPSADVMAARIRPAAEQDMRWPLCVARPPQENNLDTFLAKARSREHVDRRDFVPNSDVEYDDRDDTSEEGVEPQWPRAVHVAPPRDVGELFVAKRAEAARSGSWQFHYVV